uniref:Uncharacterized protein n=1 Tax=Panagrolaimus davidi TaxID=227884 RepID=A0A914QCG4_9BILA
MTTKDEFLFKKDNNFVNDNLQIDNGSQYSNLNLNQNYKCPILIPVQSYSKTFYDKNCENGKSQSWNKSSNLASKSLKFDAKVEDEKEEKSSFTKTTNSTIHLHITTYGNSTEAGRPQFCNKNCDEITNEKFGSIKKCKKQFFAASKLFTENLFEFPRQQNDKLPEPELSQFKASQRLFKPNIYDMKDAKYFTKVLGVFIQLNQKYPKTGHKWIVQKTAYWQSLSNQNEIKADDIKEHGKILDMAFNNICLHRPDILMEQSTGELAAKCFELLQKQNCTSLSGTVFICYKCFRNDNT